MKKYFYGIIDSRTGNFGDICVLDRDEEFRDGCLTLFRDMDMPDYILCDLLAYCYGSVTFDDTLLYPKFDVFSPPHLILSGDDVVRQRKQSNSSQFPIRKDDVSHEKVSENS